MLFGAFWKASGLRKVGPNLTDPFVVYDEWINAFVVGDLNVNKDTRVSALDLAVSTTASPADLTPASWCFHQIVTTESGSNGKYLADFPGNPGYKKLDFIITLNMLDQFDNISHVQLIAFRQDHLQLSDSWFSTSYRQFDLAAAGSNLGLGYFREWDLSGAAFVQNLRPTVMHDNYDPCCNTMFLLQEDPDHKHIDFILMADTGGSLKTARAVNASNHHALGYGTLPLATGDGVTKPGIGCEHGSRIYRQRQLGVKQHSTPPGRFWRSNSAVEASSGLETPARGYVENGIWRKAESQRELLLGSELAFQPADNLSMNLANSAHAALQVETNSTATAWRNSISAYFSSERSSSSLPTNKVQHL